VVGFLDGTVLGETVGLPDGWLEGTIDGKLVGSELGDKTG
jgi:hypothetical protein